MKVTDVKIRKTFDEGNLRALVSVTLDDSFAVHEVKVIQGAKRLFVAMPSSKGTDGAYRDIAHPIDVSTRREIEWAVLQAYEHLNII